MIIKKLLLFVCISAVHFCSAQNKAGLVSGPWAGNVELRNAIIWVEVTPAVKKISVNYHAAGSSANKTVDYKGELGKEFNPVKIELNGLDINTTYDYSIIVDGKVIEPGFSTSFTTKDLWQWRKPAPDFCFLAGSCAYFNEPKFDRPGKPYGGDSSIFETMANTPAAFHVWLGDNWYTREVDYNTAWGLNYRASHDRSLPVLQKFMASMPQYAIWDDHDYGPNDIGKSYILKDKSREVFMNYSCNPAYGQNSEGIYSVVSYSDVDIFLTDDRWWRSEDNTPDSIGGKPNEDKTYFGKAQLNWLKQALTFSNASFKIIATGSQILNPVSGSDCMRFYKREYNELLEYIATAGIQGVLFFTGDRHHSEVIKMERAGLYTLYDVTNSPYTSGVSKVKGNELNNPARIPGTLVEAQNFTKITVSGKKNERILKVEFLSVKGDKLGEWSVEEKQLK
ncbi:MAG: alkaline phosphatase D family protein [Ferruginibacter sp.]